jgi:hypothetical protein
MMRIAFALTFTSLLTSAIALGSEHLPTAEPVKLEPATAYSGSAPTDLKNGLIGGNGTFGLPNAEYEKWSTEPAAAVNLSSKAYPYGDKSRFIIALEDRLAFYDAAIWNWANTPKDQKPEVLEYAKQAGETVKPALEKARGALNTAKSTGASDWPKAESDARTAFLQLQSTYHSLHKNSR